MQKLVFLDFGLSDMAGHSYEYDSNIARAFADAGWSVEVFANRTCGFNALGPAAVRPWFSHSPTSPISDNSLLRPFLKLWVHLTTTRREIRKAFAQADNEDTVFFAQQVFPYQILALAAAARGLKGRLVVMLRATTLKLDARQESPAPIARLYGFALRRLAKVLGANVIFVTDSQGLRVEYEPLSGRPVHVLPIPNPPLEATPGQAAAADDGVLTVLYSGRAATEKGFLHLPAIIRAVKDAGLPVRFIVNAFRHKDDSDPKLKAAIDDVTALMGSGDQLIAAPLPGDAYHTQLASADFSLMLYDRARYRHQTSGVLIDTIASSTRPIVTAGTWLAEVVTDTRFGEIVDENKGTVGQAVVRILENAGKGLSKAGPDLQNWPHSRSEFQKRFCSILDS
ncbi:hypothetical protein [Kordiimonas marina]|uniref:hypothetical protein n=1 Tax=Kordiimonas marina TaxID=2872312 RepID=UPI001FF46E3A|nr:hypothetical protein [Kordiimonas marina]MCJ9429972.1 hypothetical protein [Kordiimonas marina]